MIIKIEDANLISIENNKLILEDSKFRSYLSGFVSGRVAPYTNFELNISEQGVVEGFSIYTSDKSDSLTIYLDSETSTEINKMYKNIEKMKLNLNQICINVYKKYDTEFIFDENIEYNFEINPRTLELFIV